MQKRRNAGKKADWRRPMGFGSSLCGNDNLSEIEDYTWGIKE